MQGNRIVVSAEPRGVWLDVIVADALKPGVMVQIKNTAPVSGVFSVETFAPGTDGKRRTPMILTEDFGQGGTYNTTYTAGSRGKVYIPLPGELVNVRLADVSGTGDDHAIGERLIADTGTGKFLATTGSPESEPFQLLETVTDPTTDTLALAMATGQ